MPVNIQNLTQTWANTQHTYSGIGLNAVNDGCAPDSTLLRLKVDGEDKFVGYANGDFHISGAMSGGDIINTTIDLGNSANLGNVVTSGFYRLESPVINSPSGVDWGQMIVCRGGDTIFQIVTGYQSDYLWWRSGNPPPAGGAGSWGSWRRLVSANDSPTFDTVTATNYVGLPNPAAVSNTLIKVSLLTSGSSFTTQPGTTKMWVEVVGEGGDGSAGNDIGGTSYSGGAGGGGGGYAAKMFNVTGSTAYNYSIGATVSFTVGGTTISGSTGENGGVSLGGTIAPSGGLGGTGTNGDINCDGGDGHNGWWHNVNQGTVGGGNGGNSRLGTGGRGANNYTIAGSSGNLYGGGGGGGAAQGFDGSHQSGGGAGGQGCVIVWEYGT